MHPDMLLLVERLVVATERMSQDLQNISTYMYDLNYNVSFFLNERREKEGISYVPERNSGLSGTPAAGQEASAMSNSWQDEQAGETSVSHKDNEYDMTSIGDFASFTQEIKIEEQSEEEENYESCNVHNMFDSGRNNVTISKETASPSQCESEREGQSLGVRTTVNSLPKKLTAAEFIDIKEYSSVPVPQKTQCKETSSNSFIKSILERRTLPTEDADCGGNSSDSDIAVVVKEEINVSEDCFPLQEEGNEHFPIEIPDDEDYTTHQTRHQGGEPSMAKFRKINSALKSSAERRPFHGALSNKSFTARSSLMDQTRGYSERPFSNLERLRSGEKLFVCPECGKEFLQSCHLTRHMRMHTSEKPYRCTLCGNSFTRSDKLTIHMRIHTGEKPYRCTECGDAFARSDRLKMHMSFHAGECPFACINCGSFFNTSTSLRWHRLLVHGIPSSVPKGSA